ncbi:MAG TPA: NIPSNAP family protein [Acetobacteraceae bacterium]|nr:NIPSNAP family protein [Acetobacteraceae bacterium]
MIIEMRTYQLKPGSLAEVEKRFGAALPVREKHSKLAAFWHTEIGPLNQIIHVWTYDSFEQRSQIRAAAQKEEGWPPPIREFVVAQQSEVFNPAPFSPKLEPRSVGPVFEIRQYTLAAGAIPGMIERWAPKIEARAQLSTFVGAWYSEFGALNKWVHIWAYKDAAERQRVRADAVARGIWPPGGAAPGTTVKQENMLVMPAAFSPIR